MEGNLNLPNKALLHLFILCHAIHISHILALKISYRLCHLTEMTTHTLEATEHIPLDIVTFIFPAFSGQTLSLRCLVLLCHQVVENCYIILIERSVCVILTEQILNQATGTSGLHKMTTVKFGWMCINKIVDSLSQFHNRYLLRDFVSSYANRWEEPFDAIRLSSQCQHVFFERTQSYCQLLDLQNPLNWPPHQLSTLSFYKCQWWCQCGGF